MAPVGEHATSMGSCAPELSIDMCKGTSDLVPDSSFYDNVGQGVAMASTDVVAALGKVLARLVSSSEVSNQGESAASCVKSRFDAVSVPKVSLHDYLFRIEKHFQCSLECYVFALVYIDRILKLHPQYRVTPLNIHRLLVTSVMVAAKFQDDIYYGNDFYARVAGVTLKEINALEAHFLRLMAWHVNVSIHEYNGYHVQMLGVVGVPAVAANGSADLQPPAVKDLTAPSDVLMPDGPVESTDVLVDNSSVPASVSTRARLVYSTSKMCAKRHETRQFTGRIGVSKALAKVPRWTGEQTCGVRRRLLLIIR